MAKHIVTGDQHFGITGQMLEIQRQIRLKGGSPIDPELVQLALQDIIEGKFHHVGKKEEAVSAAILKLLSADETITIDACDGTETLAEAGDVFKAYVDPDFNAWGTNKPSVATGPTPVQVHEMAKNATFAQMFGSMSDDLDKLCFTQHQIKRFCANHSNWLRQDGWATFFLFKVGDQCFVAGVRVGSGGLGVYVSRFGRGDVWRAEDRSRVVLPQLMTA